MKSQVFYIIYDLKQLKVFIFYAITTQKLEKCSTSGHRVLSYLLGSKKIAREYFESEPITKCSQKMRFDLST